MLKCKQYIIGRILTSSLLHKFDFRFLKVDKMEQTENNKNRNCSTQSLFYLAHANQLLMKYLCIELLREHFYTHKFCFVMCWMTFANKYAKYPNRAQIKTIAISLYIESHSTAYLNTLLIAVTSYHCYCFEYRAIDRLVFV